MQAADKELIALENKFWQSMVDEDADTAMKLLDEPAFMVSSHGAMKFDRAGYKEMAEKGGWVLKSFELSDMNVAFPADDTAILTYRVKQSTAERGKPGDFEQEMADSSVWTRKDGQWLCAMHTETPIEKGKG